MRLRHAFRRRFADMCHCKLKVGGVFRAVGDGLEAVAHVVERGEYLAMSERRETSIEATYIFEPSTSGLCLFSIFAAFQFVQGLPQLMLDYHLSDGGDFCVQLFHLRLQCRFPPLELFVRILCITV